MSNRGLLKDLLNKSKNNLRYLQFQNSHLKNDLPELKDNQQDYSSVLESINANLSIIRLAVTRVESSIDTRLKPAIKKRSIRQFLKKTSLGGLGLLGLALFATGASAAEKPEEIPPFTPENGKPVEAQTQQPVDQATAVPSNKPNQPSPSVSPETAVSPSVEIGKSTETTTQKSLVPETTEPKTTHADVDQVVSKEVNKQITSTTIDKVFSNTIKTIGKSIEITQKSFSDSVKAYNEKKNAATVASETLPTVQVTPIPSERVQLGIAIDANKSTTTVAREKAPEAQAVQSENYLADSKGKIIAKVIESDKATATLSPEAKTIQSPTIEPSQIWHPIAPNVAETLTPVPSQESPVLSKKSPIESITSDTTKNVKPSEAIPTKSKSLLSLPSPSLRPIPPAPTMKQILPNQIPTSQQLRANAPRNPTAALPSNAISPRVSSTSPVINEAKPVQSVPSQVLTPIKPSETIEAVPEKPNLLGATKEDMRDNTEQIFFDKYDAIAQEAFALGNSYKVLEARDLFWNLINKWRSPNHGGMEFQENKDIKPPDIEDDKPFIPSNRTGYLIDLSHKPIKAASLNFDGATITRMKTSSVERGSFGDLVLSARGRGSDNFPHTNQELT